MYFFPWVCTFSSGMYRYVTGTYSGQKVCTKYILEAKRMTLYILGAKSMYLYRVVYIWYPSMECTSAYRYVPVCTILSLSQFQMGVQTKRINAISWDAIWMNAVGWRPQLELNESWMQFSNLKDGAEGAFRTGDQCVRELWPCVEALWRLPALKTEKTN